MYTKMQQLVTELGKTGYKVHINTIYLQTGAISYEDDSMHL